MNSHEEQNRTERYYCVLTNNSNFYILQFFKYFFALCKNLLNTFTIVIPSICQNAKESRLNKIRFYNLASLISDCFTFVRNDNYFYSSLRGIGNAEAIYSIVDCFITFAHAVRLTLCALATAMTIKNNLVKTFLTSINFDSLSRKIKNPCLVINKN